MTTLQRFDPFRELHQLRRLLHGPSPLFGPVAIRGATPESADAPAANAATAATAATAWSIPMDVRRDDRQLTVSAALPGFAAAEVEVSISPDRVLAVKASRQSETTLETSPATGAATAEYLLRERRAGRFARAIRLPGGLDLDAAAINLEHGVLTVTVPVAAAAQTRKLAIGGGNGSDAADADAGSTDAAGAGIDAAAADSVC